MAGYSGTPLAKKLGIKEGCRFALSGAPTQFADVLGELPVGASMADIAEANLDVLVFFTVSRAELESRFGSFADSLAPRGGLWIAWPKRASKVPTDITEDVLREVILPTGWVDNKVCAIDETWSGLRFVRRLDPTQKRAR